MKAGPTFVFLLVIAAAACIMVAAMYGALPAPLQGPLAQLSGVFAPRAASKPYLEQYEGRWHITLTSGQGNAGTDCVGGEADTRVHDGAFTASILTQGHSARTLNAAIAADGTFAGTVTVGASGQSGVAAGSVSGAAGSGQWQDDYGCKGDINLQKLDPVVDPTVGTLANYTGHVSVMRGADSVRVYPSMALYQGDVVSVSGGEATLSFGVYPPKVVTVGDGQPYTVPAHP